MNETDLINLRLDKFYKFILYQGIEKVGFIDKLEEQYYIIPPLYVNSEERFQNGYQVTLDQIETFTEYDKNEIYKAPHINSYSETFFAKKMVIVGAGASYNFCSENNFDISKLIPLTKDLFSDTHQEILKNFPGALNLSSDISRVKDIEQYFQDQWVSISKIYDPILLSKLINTQFYLQKLLRTKSLENYNNRKNNYWSLVNFFHNYIKNKDSRERILLVSFNYDTLIEEALYSSLQYKFSSIDDYIDYENRKILLFKPHGSWNWIKRFKHQFTKKEFGQYTSPYQFSDYIYTKQLTINQLQESLNDDIEVVDQFTKEDNLFYFFYPWILIPFKDKDEFVMPDKHASIFVNFLTQIEEILIIGWKGSEEFFNRTLSEQFNNRNLKITYINHNDDAIKQNLKNYSNDITWINSKDLNIESTFTAFANHVVNKKDFQF